MASVHSNSPRFRNETILRIAPFENSEVVKRNILSGRGVVLAISHMGSWELYAQAAFQRPETRFGTIYQALRNPYLDELINRDRRRGRARRLIERRDSKLPSPCCESRDPRRCWWTKAPATEESGCRSSIACVRHLLLPPPWRSARMLRSIPPRIFTSGFAQLAHRLLRRDPL